MKLFGGPAMMAAITLVALCGCSAGAPGDEASGEPAAASPAASADPAANTPLTCADLVGGAEADTALASPSDLVDVAGVFSSPLPSEFALTSVGGLHCAWRADGSRGTYTNIGAPGVPWLEVEVLPGAAAEWNSYTFGDTMGTAETTPFAGFEGAHSCGDPGCKATAAIGSAWVSIMVHDPGFGIGQSLVASTSDEIFAQLTPAATALFSAVSSATPAQLDWPATPARAVDPRIEPCSSFLKTPALASALGVASIDEYAAQSAPDDPERTIYSIESVADRDSGFVHCYAEAGFDVRGSFTVALDNAAIVDRLASGVSPTSALHLETLENLPATEIAVSDCDPEGRSSCQIWFSMGVDALYVSRGSTDPKAVAEAIIAQAW